MININPGHNPDVLYGCKRLNDYSIFVDMINKNISKESSLENAIQKAMDYCIHHDILADILSKSRNEVMNMLLTEYDEENFSKNRFNEGRKLGNTEGENRFALLTQKLLTDNRLEDLRHATKDETYRSQLMKEYQIP